MTCADAGLPWVGRELANSVDLLLVCDGPTEDLSQRIEQALPDLTVRLQVVGAADLDRPIPPNTAAIVALESVAATVAAVERLTARPTAGPVVAIAPAGDGDLAAVERAGAAEVLMRAELDSRVGCRLLGRVVADAQWIDRLDEWKAIAREASQRFDELLDRHADGILVIDPTGLCLYANAAARSLLAAGDGDGVGDLAGRVVGIPLAGDDTLVDAPRADGSLRALSLKVTEMMWKGRPVRLAALRDLTGSTAAEAQARQAEARLAAVLNTMAEGLIVADGSGTIRAVNPATERMTGFAAADLIGGPVERLLARGLAPEDAGGGGGTATGGHPAWQEADLQCKTGAVVPVQVATAAIAEPGAAAGSPQSRTCVAVLYDVRDRKQAEASILAAKAQADVANRTKSEFLANMSHELRTPLNAIIGFAELVRDQAFGPDAAHRYADYGKIIFDSGQHLLQLINDVLDMSRIEAGSYALNESTVRIGQMVRNCFVMVGMRARSAMISLIDDVPDDLPELRADARAVKRVLQNLLSNAVKFTPPGGQVTVSAGVEADGSLRITIGDTGPGISDDAIPLVMTPFGRSQRNSARMRGGAGLGLPISANLMQMHGGRLHIESTPGEGTKVHCHFPADRVNQTLWRRP
ncbi:MAG: PAS domain S-box protein [Rhodospirillaceae bacterium]|nr:PAS domain S-box protein [Rhodospirillaceae bacterium]